RVADRPDGGPEPRVLQRQGIRFLGLRGLTRLRARTRSRLYPSRPSLLRRAFAALARYRRLRARTEGSIPRRVFVPDLAIGEGGLRCIPTASTLSGGGEPADKPGEGVSASYRRDGVGSFPKAGEAASGLSLDWRANL